MKLIVLSIGFCCCALTSPAQPNQNHTTHRPCSFQEAELTAEYTPQEPFERAATLTEQICEKLKIADESLFEKLLDINYNSELAVSELKPSRAGVTEATIRSMQKRSIEALLTPEQKREFELHFGNQF